MALNTVNSKKTVIVLYDTTNTPRVLYCDLTDITYKRSRPIAKTETFCEVSKSPGNIDGQITIAGVYIGDANDIDASLDGLLRDQTSRLYKYGPGGSGTGAVLYSGLQFVTDYQIVGKVGAQVLINATLEVDGDDVRALWP